MSETHKHGWLLRAGLLAAFLGSSGCIILDKRVAAMLMQYQTEQIIHSRLMAVAAMCLMAVPVSWWAAMFWIRRRATLRSIMILVTVEAALMAAFVGLRIAG